MAKENFNVEQFVYTAGGTKIKGVDNSAFGVLSATDGLDNDSQREISTIMNLVLSGDVKSYEAVYRTTRVLKQGAVPKGLFNKKYRDEDYETVTYTDRNEIKVLKQSHEGDLRRAEGYDPMDYREHPEKAPYRIAVSNLKDGRVLVMRIGAVNKVYSELDRRNGNYFTHAFILPKGTDITKINIDKLPFRIGLTSKEWGKNGQPIDLSVIHKESTPSEEIKDMSIDELLDVFKKTLPGKNQDMKSRMENKKIFNANVKQGTKLFEIKNLMANLILNNVKNGNVKNEMCEDILNELEIIETPYTNLLLSMEAYIDNQNKLSEAYEKDDQLLIEKLEAKDDSLRISIDQYIKTANYDELLKVAQSQREYLRLIAEKDALMNGKSLSSLNGSYMMKNDYKAANKLELIVKTNMNKNTIKR